MALTSSGTKNFDTSCGGGTFELDDSVKLLLKLTSPVMISTSPAVIIKFFNFISI